MAPSQNHSMLFNNTRTPPQIEKDRHERKLWTQQHKEKFDVVKDKTANALAFENQHRFSPDMRILEVGPGDIPVDSRLFYTARQTHNYMIEIASPAVVKINQEGHRVSIEHNRDFRAVRASMREFSIWGKFLKHYLGEDKQIDGFFARSSLHVSDQTLIDFFQALRIWTRSGTTFLIEGKTVNDPKIMRSQMVAPGLYADSEEDGHLRHGWSYENVMQLVAVMHWNLDRIGIKEELTPGSKDTKSEFLYFVATQK